MIQNALMHRIFFFIQINLCFPTYRTRIIKEGRKRKVIISDVKITDAGIFKCTSNADETEAEVVVKCKF